jgi:hypothetical protein
MDEAVTMQKLKKLAAENLKNKDKMTEEQRRLLEEDMDEPT